MKQELANRSRRDLNKAFTRISKITDALVDLKHAGFSYEEIQKMFDHAQELRAKLLMEVENFGKQEEN